MRELSEDRPRGPVYTAFARLGRHIHRLVAANLIVFLVSLPVICWFYLLINTYLNAGLAGEVTDLLPGPGYFCSLLLLLPAGVFYPLVVLSAIFWGPGLMGLTYLLKGILTGRHVWLSDLFGQARANFRQGTALGVGTVLIVHILLWNIFSGLTAASMALTALLMLSKWASVLILLLFLLALPYLYLIAVSIDLPMGGLIRDGVILARVRLGRQLLVLLGLGLWWYATSVMVPALSLLTLPLLSLSLTAAAWTAFCLPPVRRHILTPAERARQSESLS